MPRRSWQKTWKSQQLPRSTYFGIIPQVNELQLGLKFFQSQNLILKRKYWN